MTDARSDGLDTTIVPVAPGDLHFDRHNPRMVGVEFVDEDAVVSHLIDAYNVDELVLSILTAGWLDYEPLIVERDTNIVLEGNRRLAALRLITDEKLRNAVGYQLPRFEAPHPNSRPAGVSVRYAQHREDAYVFIGFKHINGPFKWDALAKAKFAAEWVERGQDLDVVSRTLGDSHNTVLRLINGWRVLQRAIDAGFDPSDATTPAPLPISHLYTALMRPSIREFLGITIPARELLARDDIPAEKTPQLLQLMGWLFGQESAVEPGVVRTQNPDLNTLVRVIAHPAALNELIETRDLDEADAKMTSSEERFDGALRTAARSCEEALRLAGSYDGSHTLFELVNNMGRTVRALREAMSVRREDPLDVFNDAAS
jgi:hypothetical protein